MKFIKKVRNLFFESLRECCQIKREQNLVFDKGRHWFRLKKTGGLQDQNKPLMEAKRLLPEEQLISVNVSSSKGVCARASIRSLAHLHILEAMICQNFLC